MEPLDLPGPGELRPDEALLRVHCCGVGNWDEIARTGGWDLGRLPPMALGVEAAGVVAGTGGAVTSLEVGDRVMTHSLPLPAQGAWAEWFVAAAADGAMVPDAVPFDVAAALPVPALTADQALRDALGAEPGAIVLVNGAGGVTGTLIVQLARHLGAEVIATAGNIPIGGTVAVLTQGPVGLMATAGAKLRGAGLIIGVESVPSRQKLARMYGADEIVDFTKEDVVQRVLQLTGGEGVDTAIEALGADATFQDAIKITKPGGTISNTGYFGEGEFVRIPRIEWGVGMADKTIATGLCPGGRLRMERLLRVLEAKRVDPTLMTTHTFRFDEMERAFEVSDKKLGDVVKPLIVF